MLTKEVATKVLKECLATGADFAEIFYEVKKTNTIAMVSKMIKNSDTSVITGVGIRILKDLQEAYGYTNEVNEESLMGLASRLASSYNDAPLGIEFELEFKETPKMSTITRYSRDIANSEKTKYLSTISDTAYAYSPLIIQVMCTLTDETQEVTIFNTKGVWRKDVRNHQRISAQAVAKDGDKMESYGEQYGGNFGVEYFDKYDWVEFGNLIASGAIKQLEAVDIPGGVYDVVIHNAFGGVIFHEACGHSLEATSVAKNLSVFSNKLGEKIAADCVTAIDDGTIVDEWGSAGMDDEGNDTQKNILIKDGILTSYMIDSRNARRMGMPSTGSGRRESYKFSPTSRMTNTYIANGESTCDEIIAATKYGIFAKKMGGGSVNPTTGEFNFSVSEGYLIEDGKVTKPIKGATLIGNGKDTLLKIDMVANNQSFGYGMCGSMSGSIPACVGQPTIRVRNMTVGGKGGNN
jgi:TldD protein